GSSGFGKRSTIKEIPNENSDPTNIPAKVNKIKSAMIEFSKSAAKVKQLIPANKTNKRTFLRPKRSLSIPRGSWESKLPAAKHGIMLLTIIHIQSQVIRRFKQFLPFELNVRKNLSFAP